MYISLLIYHLQQWLNGELHVSHSTLVRNSDHWFCAPLAATVNKMPSGNLCCYAMDCEKNHIVYKMIQGLKQQFVMLLILELLC